MWCSGYSLCYTFLVLRGPRHDAPFDPRFFERDDRFWPIVPAACPFAARDAWPDVAEYALAFGDGPQTVRFVPAVPRPRRRHRRPPGPVILDDLYDAHITRGEVPTRARHWHDFLNALVWATFPRAKRALHARQHQVVRAWVPDGATRMPGARSREHDALAVLDEGGVVLVRSAAGTRAVLFGHALYEGLVLGVPSMIAGAVVVEAPDAGSPAHVVREADAALAAVLGQPLVPERLVRFSLDDVCAGRT